MSRYFRDIFIVAISVVALSFIVRFAFAGSLNPTSTPASTMKTANEVYDTVAGDYDSSGISASKHGNLIQIGRCIIERINGNDC